jgi:hypothetical protein
MVGIFPSSHKPLTSPPQTQYSHVSLLLASILETFRISTDSQNFNNYCILHQKRFTSADPYFFFSASIELFKL